MAIYKLTNSIVYPKILRDAHLLLPRQIAVDFLERLVDCPPSVSDENEQETENEVADVADDVVERGESERA